MKPDDSRFKRFLYSRQGLFGKTVIAIFLTFLFAGLHFLQKYGWTQATGGTLSTKDIITVYLGYELLALISILIFWFHGQFPIRKSGLVKTISSHIAGTLAFSLLHSFFFSLVYYVMNPAWQEYPFMLLFKDVILNYFNIGVIFYLTAILLAELYDSRLLKLISPSHILNEAQDILKVKDRNTTYLFPLKEIAYFTSADNYVKVHCGERTALMRESMAGLEKRLDPKTFLRVHRTALINKNFVSQIERTGNGEMNLVMKDNMVLPISRRRKEAKLLLQHHA